jgi:hypothetical protein
MLLTLKKWVLVFVTTGLCVASLSAQDKSAEDLYLQESAAVQVIRDMGSNSGRDQKAMALVYIGDIINNGSANEEIRKVLEDLTMDGVLNQVRLSGRIVNNYPDLRIEAVNYLAQIGTTEAKNSLIKVTTLEVEPAVLTAAIDGLTMIGKSDNGDSLRYIHEAFRLQNVRRPDNRLAVAVINAIEAFLDKGTADNSNLLTLMTIQTNYDYIKDVRDKASALIEKIRRSGS